MVDDRRNRWASRSWYGIWVLIGLFLLLSNIYGLVTPVFEASDELYHYPYVQHLTTEHRLPVQDPANPQLWKQEGGQPPLYYWIAAAATFWIDTHDLAQRLRYNPHAKIGIPMAPDNKNMVAHTTAERFPFRGTTLAVHLIRFLSTLMGASTVLLTYLIAREVLPRSEFLPLVAASVTAFAPMFLFISASVNNDNLAALLCSLALWQMLRVLHLGTTLPRTAGIGIVVGLAILTKLSALGLIPLLALVITWDCWRQRSFGAWLRHGALAASLVLIIAGWWYIRNWFLYGDPLGFNAWLAIAGTRESAPSLAGLLAEFEGFRISYWGLFGGVNVLMSPLVYKYYDLLSLLSVIGLVVAGSRWFGIQVRRRSWHSFLQSSDPRPVQMAILGLWVLILLSALVRWTRLTPASQGRLIFPGIAAVSFWLVLGWASLVPRSWRRIALSAVAVSLLLVATLAPWLFIAPAYAQPATVSTLPDTLQPLQITYGDQIELVGFRLPERQVYPGQTLALELGWRAKAPMAKDYSIFVHLYGRDGEFLGQADTYPGGGLFPTSQWSPGDQLLDTIYVPLATDAQAPTLGRIVVGLYYFPDMSMLPAKDPQGIALGTSPTIGRFKVATFKQTAYDIPQGVEYQFGRELELVGYDLSAAPSEIVLYWQAIEPTEVDYSVFVHLVDAEGRLVAQADSQPQRGEYPTSWWSPGEIVQDRHIMPPEIVRQLPPGSYAFKLGLYELQTGARLPVTHNGAFVGDQIELGPITMPQLGHLEVNTPILLLSGQTFCACSVDAGAPKTQ